MKFIIDLGLKHGRNPCPTAAAEELEGILRHHVNEVGFHFTDPDDVGYVDTVRVLPDERVANGKGRPKTLQPGSVHSRVSQLQVGDRVYIETTPEGYAQVQREWNLPTSRRNEVTRNFVIQTSVWSCVGTKVGDVRWLVCVERTK